METTKKDGNIKPPKTRLSKLRPFDDTAKSKNLLQSVTCTENILLSTAGIQNVEVRGKRKFSSATVIELQNEILETLSSAAATALSIESVLDDLVCLTAPPIDGADSSSGGNSDDTMSKVKVGGNSCDESSSSIFCDHEKESVLAKQARLLSSLRLWGDLGFINITDE
mmetsp:Transcript_23589/g.46908  ORF Transcript_23589/g.46908 Transcript_23589/m.46908 type:complete len:168 (-) Transcript_23589:304-807(-)|eukprot:CAMPEP_0194320726 /NCGR_PEP_ID=MMETSP0171-20130528/16998_1 /TAXON_ID=218684 /ORGANISM="Corethron pennatum, Strain L29A3" /LENGTH=167 /DNA_ID=CAMNT_0039078343 /DNA_START=186 /DNA_END=689 /DNA_ORIENTATION=+